MDSGSTVPSVETNEETRARTREEKGERNWDSQRLVLLSYYAILKGGSS